MFILDHWDFLNFKTSRNEWILTNIMQNIKIEVIQVPQL